MKAQTDAERLREKAEKLLKAHTLPRDFGFVTQDADTLRLLALADKLAPLDDTVLITGESGTGKDLVARRLHGRRSGRFLSLNLSAIPESMIQSELFGHVKGAYTGAVSNRMGLLVAASRGTMFLDEIGDISPALQVLLLRVIETRKFRRIGENEDTEFKGRFIFASNKVNSGFREDLYHRIATYRLDLKPLRDRPDDIPLIVDSLDLGFTPEEIKDLWQLIRTAKKYQEELLSGNVRELIRLAKQYKVLGRDNLDLYSRL